MSTFAEVKAGLESKFAAGVVIVNDPIQDPHFPARHIARVQVQDPVGSGGVKLLNGSILVQDYGEAGESATYTDELIPSADALGALIDYITGGGTPWNLVVSVVRFEPRYQVAIVLAVTATDENDATLDYHAVTYTGSAWLTRKLTNVTPVV